MYAIFYCKNSKIYRFAVFCAFWHYQFTWIIVTLSIICMDNGGLSALGKKTDYVGSPRCCSSSEYVLSSGYSNAYIRGQWCIFYRKVEGVEVGVEG